MSSRPASALPAHARRAPQPDYPDERPNDSAAKTASEPAVLRPQRGSAYAIGEHKYSAIWPRPSARRATYSDSYASNQYRALQQFFRWWVGEEELPDPMAKLHPPKVIQCDWLQAAGPGP